MAPAAALALVVYLAYPSALSLPFTFDDPLDLPRAEHYSAWTMFTSTPGYGYYRPVLYVLWQWLHALLGRYDPFWYHFLTVGAHVINGWLVYMLGCRLANKASGLSAAVLFLLFPFSYQVVPWAGALFHPFMAMSVLGALLLYDEARSRRKPIWLVPASVLALLAMFTHEYGVTVAPLALLWPLLRLPTADGKRRFHYVAPFFALDGVFMAVWLLVPKWGRQMTLDVESLRMNGLYFLQALVYPAARLAKPLADYVGWAASTALALLALSVLMALVIMYWRGGRFRIFVFSVLWFATAVFPAWAVLNFDYVIDAPRLLYLASVGICLAWGGLISLNWKGSRVGFAWKGIAVAGLVLVIVQSWQFIAARNVLYQTGSTLVQDVVATATNAEGRALYINLPGWIGPKEDEYALGHSGVVLVPDYIGLNAVTYIHTGRALLASSAAYEILSQPWINSFGLHDASINIEALDPLLRQAGVVYLTRYGPDRLRLQEAGSLKEKQQMPIDRLADLGESFSIVNGSTMRLGNDLVVSLDWYTRQTSAVDNTVFLHLYDDSGHLIAQDDGYPLLQLSPPRLWHTGDSVADRRVLPLPTEIPAGRYTIAVGIYDRQNGQRLPARDTSGMRLANDAVVVGTIELP